MKATLRLKTFLLTLLLLPALAGASLATPVTVDLVAEQVNVTMPDAVSVPMWKFRMATNPAGSPPPVIKAVAGDSLTINLTNNIVQEPVSLVINGQQASEAGSMVPVWLDGSSGPRSTTAQRVRSFTHEAAASGGTATYEWASLRAGTYLVQSGTHPSVQMPMGLSAVLKVDAAPNQAYGSTSAYDGEAVLLFSEVSFDLNNAVASGTYGTAAYPTALAVKYHPDYFLINGAPFPGSSPIVAGQAGAVNPTLLRFLNAGSRERVAIIHDNYATPLATDGNLRQDLAPQYSVDLAPGGTVDLLLPTPATERTIKISERTLGLANGGMVAYLQFSGAGVVVDHTTFVGQLYRNFLGRNGSPAEIQGWVSQLDAGTLTRAGAVDGIMGLTEYAGRVPPIARLYFAAFQRIPDHGGLLYWVNVHAQGTPLATIAEVFATSPEFLATYGALTNDAFVTLLYQNVLGRAPDAEGLAYWVGQLDSGAKTRGDVLAGFSESAEFQTLTANEVYVVGVYSGLLLRAPGQAEFDNWVAFLAGGGSKLAFIDNLLATAEYIQVSSFPLLDNATFVGNLYVDFLGRAGSLVEIQGWVSQLDAGTLTRAETVDGIMGLTEYAGRVPPIARLYFAAFQRMPDHAGLLYWVNVHAQGTPLASIAEFFATSPEFLATYGALSNDAFITLLYQNVLGRAPDVGGLAYWVGQLDSGAKTRGDVLAGFSESAEFQTLTANEVYVVGVYSGLLLRTPGQAEFDNWVAFLDGGGSNLVFIDNLLASVEYLVRLHP
jgi:hypothetical protein